MKLICTFYCHSPHDNNTTLKGFVPLVFVYSFNCVIATHFSTFFPTLFNFQISLQTPLIVRINLYRIKYDVTFEQLTSDKLIIISVNRYNKCV